MRRCRPRGFYRRPPPQPTMTEPTPAARAGKPPAGTLTESRWPPPTRPGDLTASGFGSTGFGLADAGAPPRRAIAAGSAFDMCHSGVVLRAVLFVHAVLAIGVLFGATGLEQWLIQLAQASSVGLPGVLSWLVVACLAKDSLARLPEAAQWATAVGLGAVCAAGCWALQAGLGLGAATPGNAFEAGRWLAPALSGAALAAALFYWLRLRAVAQGPADTSARLAELQSRIRPHFLFNTLNTAITLARVDPARTEELLEDLAELFRVALADTDQAVTLGAEVELAQRYLAIEQIRFGERLRVSWDLDPAAAGARVPPLLLQPLVENAVRHGVEPGAEGGTIRVRTRLKRGHAVVTIDNTVPGEPSRPGAGMALRNVRERLHLMHDVAAQFEARPGHEVYRVRIVVPM
jgi:two-component system, LytTR family, sensor histidine kinase AlgZ